MFMCRMHSEAKQSETAAFGAEEGLSQGHTESTGSSCSKDPSSPMGAGNSFSFFSFFFSFFFWARRATCGILIPRPGIEPGPLAMKEWSLNHWTAREFPGKSFYRQNMGGGLQGVSPSSDCLVVRWQGGVPGVSIISLCFQPVWSPRIHPQPEVTILPLGAGLSSCRRTLEMCIRSHRRSQARAPSLHSSFFLPSLTPLVGNCLNLPFGTQGTSRRRKPFSYKQEMGDTAGLLHLGKPHRVLLGFNPPFLILLNFEGHRCWTRKGIPFWIEMLITNSVEEDLVLGGFGFKMAESVCLWLCVIQGEGDVLEM